METQFNHLIFLSVISSLKDMRHDWYALNFKDDGLLVDLYLPQDKVENEHKIEDAINRYYNSIHSVYNGLRCLNDNITDDTNLLVYS